ncbi:helix-turn-helix domain-containing protein [Sulfuricystis thermophila]
MTDHLDRLCRYFNCRLEELAEYVPDEDVRT